jgi:phosphomannomutase
MQVITSQMHNFLALVRKHCRIGLVGGSDLTKVLEQMGGTFEQGSLICLRNHSVHILVADSFDYLFTENGVVGFHGRTPYPLLVRMFLLLELLKNATQTIADKIGEEKLQRFINFSLHYIADLTLPHKRYVVTLLLIYADVLQRNIYRISQKYD